MKEKLVRCILLAILETVFLLMLSCASATILTIPAEVDVIGEEAFYGDTNLDEVVLPEGIRTIGPRAFSRSTVRRINLPDSLESIAEDAFDEDSNVVVTATAGTYAYQWADSRGFIYHGSPAEDFVFEAIDGKNCRITGYTGNGGALFIPTTNPDGLTVSEIDSSAFENCTVITELTIPSTVNSIGEYAFDGCTGITKLVLPEVIELGDCSFRGLSSLTELTIPVDIDTYLPFPDVDSVRTIHYLAGATGVMKDWGSYHEENAYHLKMEYFCRANLESVDFEEGITHIGNYAFYDYDSNTQKNDYALTNVTLPSTLTSIGSDAFSNLEGLTSIELPAGLVSLGIYCFEGSGLTSVTVPAGITEIPICCFHSCTDLKTIELPDGLLSINDNAFSNCSLLEALPVSETGNLSAIGHSAFQNCVSITELTIPSTVNSIGEYAFDGCTGITKLVLPEVIELGDCSFRGLSSLTELTIPVDADTYLTFPEVTTVQTIHYLKGRSGVMADWGSYHEENAYHLKMEYFCRTNLTTIEFEEGITHIGNYAFYNYDDSTKGNDYAIKRITLPATLMSIGHDAFWDLDRMVFLLLPDRCTEIGAYNFVDCENLTVTIGRLNTDAILYCQINGVRYAIGGPLTVRVYQGYHEQLHNDMEDELFLYVIGSANGGVKPYRYRLTVKVNNEVVSDTGWQDNCWAYLPVPETEAFSVRAEVTDAMGNYASSDDVPGEGQETGEKSQKQLMFEAFAALTNEAPTPDSLSGTFFNNNQPETQWLINLAADILHADLSVFQTQTNKLAYLFKIAFDAAANGNALKQANIGSLPDAVKQLLNLNAATDDSYYSAIESLCNQSGTLASYKEGLKDLVRDFKSMKVDTDEMRSSLAQMGVPSDRLDEVSTGLELTGIISVIKDVASNGAFAINSFVDVINQVYLLNAMDMKELNVIATIYMDSDDLTVNLAGQRLKDIIEAETYEERVLLVAGGTLSNLAIDRILDMFSLTDGHPVFKIVYFGVDYFLGSGHYTQYMSELEWACDTLIPAYNHFTSLYEDFVHGATDTRFELLMNRYVTYLELAASVEEAYVNVCKLLPPELTPDYAVEAAKFSSQKADKLRNLADSVRTAKSYWKLNDYSAMIVWFRDCVEIQRQVKIYDPHYGISSGGGGGGGGW